MEIKIVNEKVMNEETYRLNLPTAEKHKTEAYEPMRVITNEQNSTSGMQMNNETEQIPKMYQQRQSVDREDVWHKSQVESMIRVNEVAQKKAVDVAADECRRRNRERLRSKREGEYKVVEISPAGVPLIKNRNAYDEEMVHEFINLTYPMLRKISSTDLLTQEKHTIWRFSYCTEKGHTEIYITNENLNTPEHMVRCLKENGVEIKANGKKKRAEEVALLISNLLTRATEVEIPYSTGWYYNKEMSLTYTQKAEETWRGLVKGEIVIYPEYEASIVNDVQLLLDWLSTPVALIFFQALYRVPFELKEHCKTAGIILTVENRRMANVFLDYLGNTFPNVIRLRKNSKVYVPNDGIGILLYNPDIKTLELEKFLFEADFFPVLLVDNVSSLGEFLVDSRVPVLNISDADCTLLQDNMYIGTLLTIRDKNIAEHWVGNKTKEEAQKVNPWKMESFWRHQQIIASDLLYFLLKNEDEYYEAMKYMKRSFEEKTELYYLATFDSEDITEVFAELIEKSNIQQKQRKDVTWEELENNEIIICTPTDFWVTTRCLKEIIRPIVSVISERRVKSALAKSGALKSEKADFTKKLTLKESPNNPIAVRKRMINLDRACLEMFMVQEEE